MQDIKASIFTSWCSMILERNFATKVSQNVTKKMFEQAIYSYQGIRDYQLEASSCKTELF